jgi:hypothetical protein
MARATSGSGGALNVQILKRTTGIIGGVIFAISVLVVAIDIRGQSWSPRERENAISQHGAFMVIMQPGSGFCYVKQSYYDDTSKMELIFREASLSVVTPYYAGIEGDVKYRVDDGPERIVKNSEIRRDHSFDLSPDVVGEMKTGNLLHIRVKPKGQPARTQSFSLLGFAAAARELAGPEEEEIADEEIAEDSSNPYTPGSIIYIRSPVVLKPFPDENSLGLEEVTSGHQLMYIQKQGDWLEVRAIGTGGKSGWITESVLAGKMSGVVVTAIENEAFRGFVSSFWEYSRSLEQSGFKPFTDVAYMGDGIIMAIATDEWLAQPREKRDRDVGSIFQLWAIADGSGLPVAVYVYDQAGAVRFRQD